jgi:hypothetical protein
MNSLRLGQSSCFDAAMWFVATVLAAGTLHEAHDILWIQKCLELYREPAKMMRGSWVSSRPSYMRALPP